MNTLDFLRDPVWQRVALVLLHFVWQGAAAALVLAAAMWLLRVRRPQVRYAACLAGLALMAVCPGVTFFVLSPATDALGPAGVAANDVIAPLASDSTEGFSNPPTVAIGLLEQLAQAIEEHDRFVALIAPYLVLFWFVGVGVFGGRLLLGFAGVHWLSRGRRDAGTELVQQAIALAQRMGLRRVPRLAVCARVREALAVGFVRPMVLLPAAWATELPPDVLRAVLAHELAHIRRWDVWVNLAQRVVETLLFYHPAVWWVSRRLRAERELCCDDLAVTATGGRVEYAQALECVAQRRLAESSPLLAAGIGGRKMALLKRVRHVLGTEPDGASRAGRWSAGLMALAVPPALWLAVSVLAPPAVGQEEREREVREREPAESPEARERDRPREEERRELQRRERGEPRRGPFGPEFERALREAREAQARAEEARRHAEEMMRRMMQERERQIRSDDSRGEDEPRERLAGPPGPEFRERMERAMQLRRERGEEFGPPFPGLVEEIRRLREEVEQLRREVEEMRQGPRRGPFGGGEGMPGGMMQRMREMRDLPSDRRPLGPPGPPDRPRIQRERDRERGGEEDGDRDRRDGDRRPESRLDRPDRPPRPPAAPDAPRVRIERERERGERERDENRTPRDEEPERDEETSARLELDIASPGVWDTIVLKGAEDVTRNFIRKLKSPTRITRVDGFDQTVVDVTALSPTELQVRGMAPGATRIFITDERDQRREVDARVKRLERLPGEILEMRKGEVPVAATGLPKPAEEPSAKED